MSTSDLATIKKKELLDHFEEESFFREYGNPVMVSDDDGIIICMSYELYSRMKATIQQKELSKDINDAESNNNK